MPTPKVYVICDQNCKFEGMTKEQILTAITQAVNNGTIGNLDTGFITTIKTITGTPLKFFVGEQSEYEALTDDQKENLFAIITNDETKNGILTILETLQTNYTKLREGLESGDIEVAKAASAMSATSVNAIIPTEITYDKTFVPEASRMYIITATNSSNENIGTFILYTPNDLTGNPDVYSTTSRSLYVKLWYSSVFPARWHLSFYKTDGSNYLDEKNVVVRVI